MAPRESCTGAGCAALTAAPPRAARAHGRAGRRPPDRHVRRGRAPVTSSSAARRPGRGVITSTRSASSTASSTSWVTSSTVRGSRASAPASQSCISARVIASSAPKGSSRQSTPFPERSVRRKATRWRIPPESSAGRERSKPSRPSSANSAPARSRAAARERPAIRSASAALSVASSQGSSRSCWGINTADGPLTLPESGCCSPQTSSSSVVLPQPLGPTSATTSPGPTRSERSSSATTPPRGPGNARWTPSSITSAALAPLLGGGLISMQLNRQVAPFAGITPQVRRVDIGGARGRHLQPPTARFPDAISAGLPASPPGIRCSQPMLAGPGGRGIQPFARSALLAQAETTGRVSARTKSSSCPVVQHSKAVQNSS